MPTYEYVCKANGHRLEVVQSMTEPALTVCPECGGELRKVFAPPAISFKGSGFYTTDHGKRAKRDGAPAAAKEGAGSSGKTESKDGAKMAAKPAEKKKEAAPAEGSS